MGPEWRSSEKAGLNPEEGGIISFPSPLRLGRADVRRRGVGVAWRVRELRLVESRGARTGRRPLGHGAALSAAAVAQLFAAPGPPALGPGPGGARALSDARESPSRAGFAIATLA